MSSTQICRHVVISGRVQGVGFRAGTRHKAASLGLSGWVRNLPHGDVEVKAWGDPAAVQQLMDWCRHGPPYARVTNLTIDEATPDENVSGFGVR